MKAFAIFVAAVLFGAALIVPCSAQTLENDAAYQELLKLSDPSGIVAIDGNRYVRAPQGVNHLPGGYNGFFKTKTFRLPNGQEIQVIDPAQPLSISKGPANAPDVPDRVRKIVAALEKIGLHPKVTALPQAISGHRIDVDIGEEKPGNTRTNLIIHIGAAEKVRQVYKASEDWAKGTLRVGYGSEPVSVPQWTGLVIFATDSPNYHEESRKLGAETYASAESLGGCIKRDVMVTVIINRFDTQTWTQFRQSNNIKMPTTFAETDAYIKRTTALSRARSLQLSVGLKPQAENWVKVLTKIIDDVDAGIAPAAPPPPPKTPPPAAVAPPPVSPPVATTAPVAPPVKRPPRTTRSPRDLFPAGPPTLIGGRIERWWHNTEDYAAEHPNRWAGDCYMTSGGAITALGIFVPGPGWMLLGAGLFTAGVALYHNEQKNVPPPEPEVVRDARERLQKYQEEWKRGFSDSELNELGIFMDHLNTLTPQQRAQVYKDADIEFQSRAEAFRYMREEQERERRSGR